METIRIWAVGLCAACLTTGIVSFFIPSKHFAGVMKAALAAFFITVLVQPFLAHRAAFETPSFAQSESQAQNENNFVNETIVNAAADAVKEKIEQALAKKPFAYSSVDVCMHMSADGSIDISEITISGVQEDKAQALHDYLKKKLGLEVSVRT